MEMFGQEFTPLAWGLVLFLIGASLILIAKIYGLIFMRNKTPHRVGDAMNVTRAEVTDWSGKEGYVLVGGELWKAMSSQELSKGDAVIVDSMNGLVLKVKKK